MPRTLCALLAATLMVAAAACEPTGSLRCDKQYAELARAEAWGYKYDCTPPTSWEPHLGWADHEHRTLYVWAAGLPIATLQAVMAHELGHVQWDRLGKTGTQTAEETWSDGFAWCFDPQPGVSYLSRPTYCAPYLR